MNTTAIINEKAKCVLLGGLMIGALVGFDNTQAWAAEAKSDAQAGLAKGEAAKVFPPIRGQNIKVLCKSNDNGNLTSFWIAYTAQIIDETMNVEGRGDRNVFDFPMDTNSVDDADFEFLFHFNQ
jgi:hypothetical protein